MARKGRGCGGRGRGVSLAALLLLGSLGCGGPAGRAGWVVRHDLAGPSGPEKVCGEARRAGLDTLLLQVRGRGDAYYDSDLAPRAQGLAPDADPLGAALEACSETRTIAWMNVYFVWEGDEPPGARGHVRTARPEWMLRDADGRSVAEYGPRERAEGWIEGAYVDPAAWGYRDRFARLTAEVVRRYDVQGVHLDFVRYPGPDYGQVGPLGDLFRDAWGLHPRWIPEAQRVPDLEGWLRGNGPPARRVLSTFALLWADLRSAQVTALVREVRQTLDREAPGLELSAAVFPDPGTAYLTKGQDWRTWAAEGLVDALYPMAYFGGADRVRRQLEQVAWSIRPVASDVALWAGLGAYIKEPSQVREEARCARQLGFDGVCLFDVGTLLAGETGLPAYAAAIHGRRRLAAEVSGRVDGASPSAGTRGGRWLTAIVERAGAGKRVMTDEAARMMDRRWEEFRSARRRAIPAALHDLRNAIHDIPPWVELRGVFRYVDPLDGKDRRREQVRLAEQARQRLLAGEDPDRVAEELSQGGTRRLGGVLPRRYLRPSDPFYDELAPLAEGEVSPVLEASNGFWVYRVEQRGEARRAALDDAPWPVRRQWFLEALEERLGDGGEGRTFPSGRRDTTMR